MTVTVGMCFTNGKTQMFTIDLQCVGRERLTDPRGGSWILLGPELSTLRKPGLGSEPASPVTYPPLQLWRSWCMVIGLFPPPLVVPERKWWPPPGAFGKSYYPVSGWSACPLNKGILYTWSSVTKEKAGVPFRSQEILHDDYFLWCFLC